MTDDCGWQYYFALDDGASADKLAFMAHTRKVREIDVNTYFSCVKKKEVRCGEVVYRQIRAEKRDSSSHHI